MPQSREICQPVEAGISDDELQDYINGLKGPGGAHRVWIENRDGKKFVCRTYWINDAPLTSASPELARGAAAAPVDAAAPAGESLRGLQPPPPEPPSRDLNQLTDAFRAKVDALLQGCAARAVQMRPYYTIRSPFQQARLWRQSRSSEEVDARVAELRQKSAPFLADCIVRVGPQQGNFATNAVPGLSWHQWREAVDCFWLVGNEAEWSARKKIDGVNGYQVYAEEAQSAGLTAGGLWTSIKDWPHVQLRAESSPLKTMGLVEIDAEMKRRFDS